MIPDPCEQHCGLTPNHYQTWEQFWAEVNSYRSQGYAAPVWEQKNHLGHVWAWYPLVPTKLIPRASTAEYPHGHYEYLLDDGTSIKISVFQIKRFLP